MKKENNQELKVMNLHTFNNHNPLPQIEVDFEKIWIFSSKETKGMLVYESLVEAFGFEDPFWISLENGHKTYQLPQKVLFEKNNEETTKFINKFCGKLIHSVYLDSIEDFISFKLENVKEIKEDEVNKLNFQLNAYFASLCILHFFDGFAKNPLLNGFNQIYYENH